MGNGPQAAGHEELIGFENPAQENRHGNGAAAPGGAVNDCGEIPGEHGPQEHPDGQHCRAFPGPQDENGKDRYDIGKAQLHTGQGDDGGNLGFQHENRQSDGAEKPQKNDFFRFHLRHHLSNN